MVTSSLESLEGVVLTSGWLLSLIVVKGAVDMVFEIIVGTILGTVQRAVPEQYSVVKGTLQTKEGVGMEVVVISSIETLFSIEESLVSGKSSS